MKVVRQVRLSDVPHLLTMSKTVSSGLTSLPPKEKIIREKVEKSVASFNGKVKTPGDEIYFFVMEDIQTKEVVGSCAIDAVVGINQPFFSYKISHLSEYSKVMNRRRTIKYLHLVSDYQGATEICSLYLMPLYRKQYNGRLLSFSRFLYMANYPERFTDLVFAELRGISDKKGYSPFWYALGIKFFEVNFTQADYLTGLGDKQFIYDLMPRFPIYINLLPESAQEVLGKTHENTEPAKNMLERQGFQYKGYVDIFDAGPTVEAPLKEIKTVRESQVLEVSKVTTNIEHESYLMSNTQGDFCACVAPAIINEDGRVHLHRDGADALQVEEGSHVRLFDIHV